jgi:LCP family protein required for cell wall assembly
MRVHDVSTGKKVPHRHGWLFLLLLLALVSCNAPGVSSLAPALAMKLPLATIDPFATPSSTPFLPAPSTATPTIVFTPTATLTPTITPTPTATPLPPWYGWAGPTELSAIAIPPPMPRINFASDVVNILLIGSDARPGLSGTRTDAIMVMSLNPSAGTVTLLSIPRDLFVYIPGWKMNRINAAYSRGGVSLLSTTIRYNFGITIDRWVMVSFNGFKALIDHFGGIDVYVSRSLSDRCGSVPYSYSPGTHHMGGAEALCYVRMRYSTSDIDRMRRQQEVLLAYFNKITSIDGLASIPEIYNLLGRYVQTNVGLTDLVSQLPLAATIASDTSRIRRFSIDSGKYTPWIVPYSGASVLLPIRSAIQAMLRSAFG